MGMRKATALLLLATFGEAVAVPAIAQIPPAAETSAPDAVKYANNRYLAYIKTFSAEDNRITQEGLQSLVPEIRKRTSQKDKMAGVVGLDLERDDLSYFSLIYWRVPPGENQISEKAREKILHYLGKGGTLLIDIRDPDPGDDYPKMLKDRIGDIALGPLTPVTKDHPLSKTFYRTQGLPGATNYNPVGAEAPRGDAVDNVSSVIIGLNDWAGALAGHAVPKDREAALHALINIFTYSLIGNLKEDHDLETVKSIQAIPLNSKP